MRRARMFVGALIVALGVTMYGPVSGAFAHAGTGDELWAPIGKSRYDQGIATATIYWSWTDTVKLNNIFNGELSGTKQAAVTAAAGIMCGIMGSPVGAGICAAFIYLYWNAIREHLAGRIREGTCTKWTFLRPVWSGLTPPVLTGLDHWHWRPAVDNAACGHTQARPK